jgi:hypothetical protein
MELVSFNIIFPSMTRSLFSSPFASNNCLSEACYIPAHFIITDLIALLLCGEGSTAGIPLLCHSLHSCVISPFKVRILSSPLSSQTSSTCLRPLGTETKFDTYKQEVKL